MKTNDRNWKPAEIETLWTLWKNARADISMLGFSEDYAAVIKRTPHAIRQKVSELVAERGGKIPKSDYGTWNNAPKVEGDFFILMDAHIPYHHDEFINRCMAICKKWKIRKMVLGGDALDLHSFNQFAENFADENRRVIDARLKEELLKFADNLTPKQRMELEDKLSNAEIESGNIATEIQQSRKVLKAFETHFDHVLWIMGNHEQRITRLLQKTLDAASLARLFGADEKWTVSGYFWAEVISGGVKWQIEHPINTGKHSSKKLAPKYGCNIVMGHNHHFSVTTDPSGEFIAVECGMGADESKMDYVNQRHNAADRHIVGAAIIRNGKITLLNKFTDWDML